VNKFLQKKTTDLGNVFPNTCLERVANQTHGFVASDLQNLIRQVLIKSELKPKEWSFSDFEHVLKDLAPSGIQGTLAKVSISNLLKCLAI
jgi:hypothetical protein